VKHVQEYTQRLDARRASHARLVALDERLSYTRLAVFAAAALVAWLALRTQVIAAWWLILPALGFAWLMNRHDVVIRRREAAGRAVSFYERGLARIEDRWIGGGEPGDRFRNDDHLYANDLDLFGRGSLFELLSTARTLSGEGTLAAWLTVPATPDIVMARHESIAEMAPLLDLREELAIAGSDVRAGVNPALLTEWANSPAELGSRAWWVLAAIFSILSGATAAQWAMGGSPRAFIAVGLVEGVLFAAVYRRATRVLHQASSAARDLDILAHVLERLEREQFAAARLSALRASLDSRGVAASTAIRRLHRLSEMHDWEHNLIFKIPASALLWSVHLGFAIERWRASHGPKVAGWLATVGEVEALSSLSAYRYEHPDDVFPEVAAGEPARFDGEGLGHPLLPAARGVRNDVRLAGATRLLVVSGSNMSGKSTLLRTVGINTVLALAGAPVRASRLRLTPLAVGATLRIQDSLQEGRSRFFAEITRIRKLADVAAGPTPLLFLLDELFHGTNSHDRLLGATGVLRSLLDRGAIGLITTHDLALTRIADDLAPRAANVHFEDTFEGNEIRFDYKMKAGPVTRSNAIALMRAVGLDIPDA
jgi:hypothetical protein